MQTLRSRGLILAVTLLFALTVTGCGALMHPERKTAKPSDKIDSKTLILDCLWLLAGVVPGIVALGVDFYNDTIYFSEDELKAQAGDKVTLNLHGKAPADSVVTLGLVDRDGAELASAKARATSGAAMTDPLSLVMPEDTDLHGARLVVAVDGRAQASWRIQPRAN